MYSTILGSNRVPRSTVQVDRYYEARPYDYVSSTLCSILFVRRICLDNPLSTAAVRSPVTFRYLGRKQSYLARRVPAAHPSHGSPSPSPPAPCHGPGAGCRGLEQPRHLPAAHMQPDSPPLPATAENWYREGRSTQI